MGGFVWNAAIVIFGGSFAATLIRFPLASIFHGLPLGAKFAFTLRRMSQRDLVDEIAGLAEVARKQGPIGLEKVEIEDPFLAKGVRFVADGYDGNFIRDNLERDRPIGSCFRATSARPAISSTRSRWLMRRSVKANLAPRGSP